MGICVWFRALRKEMRAIEADFFPGLKKVIEKIKTTHKPESGVAND